MRIARSLSLRFCLAAFAWSTAQADVNSSAGSGEDQSQSFKANVLPRGLWKMYGRIDADFSDADVADLATISLPFRRGASLAAQDRIGLIQKLGRENVKLASRSQITAVRALRDDYAELDVRIQLSRSCGARKYRYEVRYRDRWFRTGDVWKIEPAAPISIRDTTPSETPRTRGTPARMPLCGLRSTAIGGRWGLGPTDYAYHVRPMGKVSAVMVFVDFPDAPGDRPTQDLYQAMVPKAQEWFAEVSNGTMSLEVRPLPGWRRLPHSWHAYSLINGNDGRRYTSDVVSLPDSSEINFLNYDIVYIVPAHLPGTGIGTSSTLNYLGPGTGVAVPGGELREIVTFGNDIYDKNLWDGPLPNVLIHETGHVFGLPDLYQAGIGGWDIMSWTQGTAPHSTAWSQAKFGWISENQIQCAGTGTTEATLTPVETIAGLKALVAPVAESRAYVMEARELIGTDVDRCDEGVLIYTVDTSDAWGLTKPIRSPMKLVGDYGHTNKNCGPGFDATFDLRSGKTARFEDKSAGVSVQVIGSSLGAYRVRVVNRATLKGIERAKRGLP